MPGTEALVAQQIANGLAIYAEDSSGQTPAETPSWSSAENAAVFEARLRTTFASNSPHPGCMDAIADADEVILSNGVPFLSVWCQNIGISGEAGNPDASIVDNLQ